MLDELLLRKLAAVEARYDELSAMLGDATVLANRQQMQKLSKEHADLRELIEKLREHREIVRRADEARELQKDPEMREMAHQEESELLAQQEKLEQQMKVLLMPKDPNDEKNILLEIRAGTGGEEAALFAADLFRMYTRFAERRRWQIELLSSSSASAGGLREVIVGVNGKDARWLVKLSSAGVSTSRCTRLCTGSLMKTLVAKSGPNSSSRYGHALQPLVRWPTDCGLLKRSGSSLDGEARARRRGRWRASVSSSSPRASGCAAGRLRRACSASPTSCCCCRTNGPSRRAGGRIASRRSRPRTRRYRAETGSRAR